MSDGSSVENELCEPTREHGSIAVAPQPALDVTARCTGQIYRNEEFLILKVFNLVTGDKLRCHLWRAGEVFEAQGVRAF